MTTLLEFRDRLLSFYQEYDSAVLTAFRFVVAFISCFIVTSQIGFLPLWGLLLTSFVPALVCAMLSVHVIAGMTGALIVIHAFRVSGEAGIVSLALFILIVLLYFSYKPEQSVLAVISFIACFFNMGGCIPVFSALLFGPTALLPILVGLFYYGIAVTIRTNYTMLAVYNERLLPVAKMSALLQELAGNRRLLMLAAAFMITYLVVWTIRRKAFAYAWNIAIATGTMTYILIILISNLAFDISISLGGLIMGSAAGVAVALAEELFFFTLDGSRIEYLEYEDEDYHYFVKAIPKYKLAASELRVKRITEREESEEEPARAPGQERPDSLTDTAG